MRSTGAPQQGQHDLLAALRQLPSVVQVAPEDEQGHSFAVRIEAPRQLGISEVAHLHEVQDVFDATFGDAAARPDLDITGWTSGISRIDISAEVMSEWVHETVTTLKEVEARRVLEIGCGTGLLLARLAPGCERYVATDLSPVVVDRLRDNLRRQGLDLPQLELRVAAADASDIVGPFDLVVLNSVVQYFPSADYLGGVLDLVVPMLAPQGVVFVGDVRNLVTLPAYAREAARAGGSASSDIERDAQRREVEEPELVLHPDWFRALSSRWSARVDVEIRLKAGRDSELTRYRYDVLLHKGRARPEVAPRPWGTEASELLRAAAGTPIVIMDAPDDRAPDSAPQRLLEAAVEHGLAARRGWPASDRAGRMDILLAPPTAQAILVAGAPKETSRPSATNPGLARTLRDLRRSWTAKLHEAVPAWSHSLSLSVSGGHGLPQKGVTIHLTPPETKESEPGALSDAPSRSVVRQAWCELLGLDAVEEDDDFFALGGHSLLAAQVQSRIQDGLGVTIDLRDVMDNPEFGQLTALLDRSVQENGRQQHREPHTRPRRTHFTGPIPASPAQRQLWFLHKQDPIDTAYHVPYALPWASDVDMNALERALTELLSRHEALRTRFVEIEGAPYQEVTPVRPVVLEMLDVSSGDNKICDEFVRASFDLSSGELLRAAWLQRGAEGDALLLVLHHIATDGRSMRVLVDELVIVYEAYRQGEPSPLAPVDLRYRDFAVWQDERLSGELVEAQLEQWRSHLAGAPDHLDLPVNPVHRPGSRDSGALLHFNVDSETLAALAALEDQGRTTLFTVLFAGLSVVLSRTTDQDDLIVGTPVANRPHPSLECLVGLFVNTVPLRISTAGDPRFSDFLARAHETALFSQSHQDVPFDRLVREFAPSRTSARSPLIQVALALQNTRKMDQGAAGDHAFPALTPLELDKGGAKFELSLSFESTTEGMSGLAEYDSGLFDPGMVLRLVGHLFTLLRAAAAQPGARLSELPILSEQEREQLRDFSAGPVVSAHAADVAIHDLVATWAAKTPDALAVSAGKEQLTYQELQGRSSTLAQRLREAGVEQGAVVGVSLPRGVDLIVAVLAVLQVGAAYLPLDPEYPQARRKHMLADVGATAIISEDLAYADVAPHLPVLRPAGQSAGRCSASPTVPPQSTAYVVYTSGSTGVPKGVAVPHSAVVNLVTHPLYCSLEPGDRVAQAATPNFDAFTFEVWAPLAAGATVVVLDRHEILDPDELAAAICRESLSAMFVTTALFESVARVRPDAFAPLRTLLFGGESVDVGRVANVVRNGAPTRLVHVYGPTEATTFSSWHDVLPIDLENGPLPIGRPVQGAELHVLDGHMRPVPVGAAGELYIAGRGLAIGYVGMHLATAAVFPTAPCGGGPPRGGERLYRTGDVVRRRADGELVFLGRRDRQVKVRGHRIELDEVEIALTALSAVSAASAVLRQTPNGAQLAAVVVLEEHGPAVDAATLIEDLKRSLPAYLIPQHVALVPELPLGPTGKTDLAEVQRIADASTSSVSFSASIAPRDVVEQALWEIWVRLLARHDFGVTEDFFALGGHSLLVTRLVAAINAELGLTIDIRTVFENSTIERLALAVLTQGLAELDGATIANLLESEVHDGA